MKKTHHKSTLSFGAALWLMITLLWLVPGLRSEAAGGSEPAAAPATEKIRDSVIAGSWYPASPARLQETIREYLDKVPATDSRPGQLVALISPHAGYVYSGQVAAYAYKLLERHKFETVVVIAPSHHARFNGVSVYDQGGYRTPLGVVELDRDLVAALKARDPRIRYVPEAHAREHSLEIQLPFLQVLLPGFKLVPLVMGDQSFAACEQLAQTLADCIGERHVLLLASSDLSHFHGYEQARLLDDVVAEHVRRFDPRGLSNSLAQGKCEACGGGPMVAAMLAARRMGANDAAMLHYANSGDVTGDRSRVVGYLAAALWNKPAPSAEKQQQQSSQGVDLGLDSTQKALLHQIASAMISAHCKGEKAPTLAVTSPVLNEPRGCFVTLKKGGTLRGCIGHITADRPLAEMVAEMALAAAFHDPRFNAVSADELKDLTIEISVLTPLRRVSGPDEIQVGVHGIYMRRDGRAGLLLPQVATEYGWDRITFLKNTCRKAGLPEDAWQDPATEIYTFSADVF